MLRSFRGLKPTVTRVASLQDAVLLPSLNSSYEFLNVPFTLRAQQSEFLIDYYSTPNFFQQLGTGAVNVMTSFVVGCSKVIERQWRAIPSGNFCRDPYL